MGVEGNSRAAVAGNPVVAGGNPSAAVEGIPVVVEGIQVGVEGSLDCRQEEVPVAAHLLRAHYPL